MTIKERHLRKDAFLQVHVFHSLNNLNDGFDAMNINYFKEWQFRIVLERCKAMGIGLYGIEPWKNGEFFDLITLDESLYKADDPQWYFEAFEKLISLGEDLDYSASFNVPIKLLELDYYPANPYYLHHNKASDRKE